MATLTIGLAEAKNNFSKITAEVNRTGEPVTVLKNNKPWVVIQPAAVGRSGDESIDYAFVSFADADEQEPGVRHLHIVWSNADPVAAENMVFMYASNSMRNGWWDRVTVVVWGPTQTLLVEDEEVRAAMEDARGLGVEFSACLTCADKLGLTKELEDMGLEVVRWGKRLSGLLQSGAHVITV